MKGVTLAEVVITLLILGILLPPLYKSFVQSYAITSRQINQDTALKTAEAVLNQAKGVEFAYLANPPDGASIPFHIELPGDIPFDANLTLTGVPAQGAVIFPHGNTVFRLSLRAEKIFGPGISPSNVSFSFADQAGKIATYACPDNFLLLSAMVEYLSGNQTQSVTLKGTKTD